MGDHRMNNLICTFNVVGVFVVSVLIPNQYNVEVSRNFLPSPSENPLPEGYIVLGHYTNSHWIPLAP